MGNIFKYIIICMGIVSCVNTQQQIQVNQINNQISKQKVLAFQDSILQSHPDWSDSVKKQIHRHNVSIGMTSNMVIAALGLPIYVDKAADSGSLEKRLSFSKMYFTNGKDFTSIEKIRPFLLEPVKYIYIDNGRVTNIKISH